MGSPSGKYQSNSRLQQSFLEALRELRGYQASENQNEERRPGQHGLLQAGKIVEISTGNEKVRFNRRIFNENNLVKESIELRKREEKDLVQQLLVIREKIKNLTKAEIRFDQQVRLAIIQNVTPEPGKYHRSYFEQLASFITMLTKNLEAASVWLTAFNHKSRKRNYYWKQVKNSGSRFYLSGDRSPANQAG
jgi:hypothetical protein